MWNFDSYGKCQRVRLLGPAGAKHLIVQFLQTHKGVGMINH